MTEKCESLSHYIATCHFNTSVVLERDKKIFDHGIAHPGPTLESNRINRILLYPGTFNPPHRGHEALLHRAFECSKDINVIAAIVLPLDDRDVEAKCRGEGLVLTKHERVRLWRGDYVPHLWYWVYDRSTDEWDSFRRSLTNAITQDSFSIRFVVLVGPDHIGLNSPIRWGAWDCKEVIVSDAGRTADFVVKGGGLLRLKGCHEWKPVAKTEEELTLQARHDAAWICRRFYMIAPKAFETGPQKDPRYLEQLSERLRMERAEKIDKVRICFRRNDHEQWIQFLHADEPEETISSTDIRRTIMASPIWQLSDRIFNSQL